MKVTNINVGIVKSSKVKNLVGMASVEFDGMLVLKDIKILDGKNGLFLGMPNRKSGDNYQDIFYFRTKESKDVISSHVLKAFIDKLEKEQIKLNEELTPIDDGDMPF